MKKISIVIPTYNEEENVAEICSAVKNIMETKLQKYNYEILFIDNDSKDKTRLLISGLCAENKKVKAIFNAKNFGPNRSPYHGLISSTGDCAILLVADFQEPPEKIVDFVREWEKGAKIVCGIKNKSRTNPIIHGLRTLYYKMINSMSDVEQIEHFNCFGLYDRGFLDVLASVDDPQPYLRGLVSELGFRRSEVRYTQEKRRAGKSSFSFMKYYDFAMLGFTSYTKAGLRIALFFGVIISFIGILIAICYLILKLTHWDSYPGGTAPTLIGVFLFGGIQLFFIGLLGEYVLSINSKIVKRPLVIEEKRINFENSRGLLGSSGGRKSKRIIKKRSEPK
ncbi:MAG: glycosyltransferase family 2 protein [Spirochaetota bacterium]|nr:glycosyltransferase family 2 protein [Spirochaetota bacterium]